MAVQKKILTRTLGGVAPKIDPAASGSGETIVEVELQGGVGTLALGKPGDIWSRAYGPLVYAVVTETDVEFGSFVEKLGILVNGNDVANESARFAPTTVLKAGQTGAFMVSGAAVVLCRNVPGILAGMNARVLGGYDETKAADYANDKSDLYNDVCVVEVNGFSPESGSDSGN